MPPSSDPGDRHGWNTLARYLHIHDKYMQALLNAGFVVEDGLQSEMRTDPDLYVIEGRIRCQHGLFVDVKKELETRIFRHRIEVRTSSYSYHAGLDSNPVRGIFRYDNAHDYPGHADAHHRHQYDCGGTWRQFEPPAWIGAARWPHLDAVILELEDWWNSTGQHLELG